MESACVCSCTKLCERCLAFLFLRRYPLSVNCLNWIEVEVPRIRGTFLVIGSFVRRRGGRGTAYVVAAYVAAAPATRTDGVVGIETRSWKTDIDRLPVYYALPRVLRERTWALADTVMTCVRQCIARINDNASLSSIDHSNPLTSELLFAKYLIDFWTRQLFPMIK